MVFFKPLFTIAKKIFHLFSGLLEHTMWGKRLVAHIQTKRIFRLHYSGQLNYADANSRRDGDHKKTMIYFADGRRFAGGLADRLRGIVSLYKIAKELDVGFKIHMTSPVELTDYLLPNRYDWTIKPGDICYDAQKAVIYDLIDAQKGSPEIFKQEIVKTIRYYFRKYRQIHISANIFTADSEYGLLMKELFTPTADLREEIDLQLQNIRRSMESEKFISASFRFLTLLGDFTDSVGSVLEDGEKNNLIKKCISHLEEIHSENPGKKILVTSDSIMFLNAVKTIDWCCVMQGKIIHLDRDTYTEENKPAFMKVFVDYFVLTHSEKLYLVVDGMMHPGSGYVIRAALYNNTPLIIKQY